MLFTYIIISLACVFIYFGFIRKNSEQRAIKQHNRQSRRYNEYPADNYSFNNESANPATATFIFLAILCFLIFVLPKI